MGWLIGLIFSLVMTLGGGIALALDPKNSEAIPALIVFIVLDLIFFKKYRNKKSGKTAAKKEKKKEDQDRQARTMSGKHQAGLPLPQDAVCTIFIEDDCFKISGGGNDFELKKSKMTDLTVKTDAEIQRQYVSSIGGAVAGGMVFGPLGAIVGGRAKEKKTTTVTHYLIFTYRSNDEINYISFEIHRGWLNKAQKWSKEIHNQVERNNNNIVEL